MTLELPAGVRWSAGGYAVLSGPALRLHRRLDALFARLAESWQADELSGSPLIAAEVLDRVGYFQAFPHLATFAVTLDRREASLRDFAGAPFAPAATGGGLAVAAGAAPVHDVLTPAACYHVYPGFAGQTLDGPRLVTIASPCFRREARYLPLERQWSFTMREVVCLGSADEVSAFLAAARARVDGLLERLGLGARWAQATDPFFEPRARGRLMQMAAPLKSELIHGAELAIASINMHQAHFGEAFAIERDGAPAFSGCLAFGIERWVSALTTSFGGEAEERLDRVEEGWS
jgi:seryl-tRNA synthetase